MSSYRKDKFTENYFIGRHMNNMTGETHRINNGNNAVTGERGYFYLNPNNKNQYLTITHDEFKNDWGQASPTVITVPKKLKGKQVKNKRSGNVYTVTVQYQNALMIDCNKPHVYQKRITNVNLNARWEIL